VVSAFFPPGADAIGIFARHPVGHRKAEILRDVFGLFERIDCAGDDANAERSEIGTTLLIAD